MAKNTKHIVIKSKRDGTGEVFEEMDISFSLAKTYGLSRRKVAGSISLHPKFVPAAVLSVMVKDSSFFKKKMYQQKWDYYQLLLNDFNSFKNVPVSTVHRLSFDIYRLAFELFGEEKAKVEADDLLLCFLHKIYLTTTWGSVFKSWRNLSVELLLQNRYASTDITGPKSLSFAMDQVSDLMPRSRYQIR